MNEKQFYQKVKLNLPQVYWTRIENSVGSGMFDLNGTYADREVWVELKEEYREGILIRPSQHAWSWARSKQAKNMWYLGFFKNHNAITLYQAPVQHVQTHERWLRVLDPADHIIDPINWKTLLNILFGSHPQ